jgi:hypothetical protein
MQEKHHRKDADRKDKTHQRQYPVMFVSYEQPHPNNDNTYALRYSLRKHTQETVRSTKCAHEVQEAHNTHNQKDEG